MANLIRKTHTKLYQNRPRFVKDMTKTFWCVFFGLQCRIELSAVAILDFVFRESLGRG